MGPVFVVLLWLGLRRPLRVFTTGVTARVVRNFLIAIPGVVLLRLALVPIPYSAAQWAQATDFGLLHWLGLPLWTQAITGFLIFDYAYYWWHIANHRIPLLWRLHNVHHTDLDMDVSTAARFHFLDIVASVPYRAAVVALFGVAPLVYLFYELCFELFTAFHHSNWRLPERTERGLGALFITPRLHGIHHSVVRDETNSNWGTVFSWWDRLHRSHRLDIAQKDIVIGVPAYRDERELSFYDLLVMPFRPLREWKWPDGDEPTRDNPFPPSQS